VITGSAVFWPTALTSSPAVPTALFSSTKSPSAALSGNTSQSRVCLCMSRDRRAKMLPVFRDNSSSAYRLIALMAFCVTSLLRTIYHVCHITVMLNAAVMSLLLLLLLTSTATTAATTTTTSLLLMILII